MYNDAHTHMMCAFFQNTYIYIYIYFNNSTYINTYSYAQIYIYMYNINIYIYIYYIYLYLIYLIIYMCISMYIIVAHIYSLPLAYTSLYTNRYQSLPIATNRPRMPPEFPLLPEHSGVLQPEATWPWAAEALRIHLQFLVKGLVLGCSLFCN